MENICLKNLQALCTIIALIAGAGFFGWKLVAGWLIANLDISIEATRQAKNKSEDWLAIKLLLKKGNVDAIHLNHVFLRICDTKSKQLGEWITFSDFSKIQTTDKEYGWIIETTKPRKYAIAPGETFQFGKIVTVPFEEALILEAAVFGKRFLWLNGGPQWRTSLPSLPIDDRKIFDDKSTETNESVYQIK